MDTTHLNSEEVTTNQYKSRNGQLHATRELSLFSSLSYHLGQCARLNNADAFAADAFAAELANDPRLLRMLLGRVQTYTGNNLAQYLPSPEPSPEPNPDEALVRSLWNAALNYCNDMASNGHTNSNATRVTNIVDAFGVEQLIRGIAKHLRPPLAPVSITAIPADEATQVQLIENAFKSVNGVYFSQGYEKAAKLLYAKGLRMSCPDYDPQPQYPTVDQLSNLFKLALGRSGQRDKHALDVFSLAHKLHMMLSSPSQVR